MTVQLPKLAEPAASDWVDYVRTEAGDARPVMLAALDRFVESFTRLADTHRYEWALAFAELHESDSAPVPVRAPLFRNVLFPSLRVGVIESRPNAARLLSQFDQQLMQSRKQAASLPKGDNVRALLEQATEDDPSDKRAWRALAANYSRWLAYTLQELPVGVLGGIDGATIEQCGDMLAGLEEFRGMIRHSGESDLYGPLLRACEFHYEAYRDYLQSEDFVGYPVYLEQHFTGEVPDW